MVMTEDEKRLTAYHEGGHALVTLNCPEYDPIHKATIIPRGRALGLVQSLPERDRMSHSREYLEAFLAIAMGGRIAEEVVFGKEKVTTGASQDIKMATDRARRMVTEWGFSEKLGPLTYGEPDGEVFLGHSVTQHKNMSERTAQMVDEEVRSIVDSGYNRAYRIITEQRDRLEAIAQALLEYETLSGEELKTIFNGGTIRRDEDTGGGSPQPAGGRRSSVPVAGKGEVGGSGGMGPEPQPGT